MWMDTHGIAFIDTMSATSDVTFYSACAIPCGNVGLYSTADHRNNVSCHFCLDVRLSHVQNTNSIRERSQTKGGASTSIS
mmetsp:Transcript_4754/g.6777  ORF Transcript_4754/g.6777 Transcript_4754/m.6777 type:complete len:80 (-) Transcript_4754:685-924(-)